VAITEPDGTANNRINDLFDPEVYVPTSDDYNEVDYNEIDDAYEEANKAEVDDDEDISVVNVVVIVFVTLIVVILFFAGIYFYYMRGGKAFVHDFVDKHGPKLPKATAPKAAAAAAKKKLTPKNWPSIPAVVANVADKESNFILNNRLVKLLVNNKSGGDDVSAVPVTSRTPRQQQSQLPTATVTPLKNYGKSQAAPMPPPRNKKSSNDFTVKANDQNLSRLATVSPRAGAGQAGRAVQPPSVPISKAGLEIGPPTSVTINGVSVSLDDLGGGNEVGNGSELASKVAAPSRRRRAAAEPAKADDNDIADSSLDQVPPPLPNCPPPNEDFEDINLSPESAA